MKPVNLAATLARFSEHWTPKIVGELNAQHVKLVKVLGEFVWHHHVSEDELFLVIQGSLRMDYLDDAGSPQSVSVGEGEFVIVPRGVEHRPAAAVETHVLLFEPAGTLNTGNLTSDRTVAEPERI